MDAAGDLTGLVLCGGSSRRMGTDKAVLDLGGRALAERAVELLRPLSARVLLSTGSADRYASLACQCVHDPIPDGGPLAGLAAGLLAAQTPWVFLLACDMPRVDRGLVEAIRARAMGDELDLCVLESERGLEP
ncbi:MAG: NTP transferase domain-containing protein, partial [Planctomycetota bacterium]|nr:NTP transferase domain-containing protein [Planctomycetota bacterium]